MKGDIAIAGFYLTAEEWQALDPMSRAALVAAATQNEPAIVAPVRTARGTEPNLKLAPISEED